MGFLDFTTDFDALDWGLDDPLLADHEPSHLASGGWPVTHGADDPGTKG